MALINRKLTGIETSFLMADERMSFVSSSLIREVRAHSPHSVRRPTPCMGAGPRAVLVWSNLWPFSYVRAHGVRIHQCPICIVVHACQVAVWGKMLPHYVPKSIEDPVFERLRVPPGAADDAAAVVERANARRAERRSGKRYRHDSDSDDDRQG